jgi:hypothetical protein
LYAPNALLLHAQRRDTPGWTLLLKETLALTKMNWNEQFDGALTITLKAARQVATSQIRSGRPKPDPTYRFYKWATGLQGLMGKWLGLISSDHAGV